MKLFFNISHEMPTKKLVFRLGNFSKWNFKSELFTQKEINNIFKIISCVVVTFFQHRAAENKYQIFQKIYNEILLFY